MAVTVADLIVTMQGDVADLKVALGEIEKRTRQTESVFGSALKALTAFGLGYLSLNQGIAILKDSVAQAIDSEKQTVLLQKAIQAAGVSWAEYGGQINQAVQAASEYALVQDEEVQAALRRLVLVTNDVAASTRNLNLVFDLARARGMDVEAAATAIGKAMEGDIMALQRFLPDLKELNELMGSNADKSQVAAEAMKIIEARVSGMGGEFGKSEKKLKEFLLAWDELKEAIGAGLLPVLTGSMEAIKLFGDSLGFMMSRLVTSFQHGWNVIVATVGDAVLALIRLIPEKFRPGFVDGWEAALTDMVLIAEGAAAQAKAALDDFTLPSDIGTPVITIPAKVEVDQNSFQGFGAWLDAAGAKQFQLAQYVIVTAGAYTEAGRAQEAAGQQIVKSYQEIGSWATAAGAKQFALGQAAVEASQAMIAANQRVVDFGQASLDLLTGLLSSMTTGVAQATASWIQGINNFQQFFQYALNTMMTFIIDFTLRWLFEQAVLLAAKLAHEQAMTAIAAAGSAERIAIAGAETTMTQGLFGAMADGIMAIFGTVASGAKMLMVGLAQVTVAVIGTVVAGISVVLEAISVVLAFALNAIADMILAVAVAVQGIPIIGQILGAILFAASFVVRAAAFALPAIVAGIGVGLVGLVGAISSAIPALAEGGIVTSPTLALIGEGGPEAVVPLPSGFGQPTVIRPAPVYLNGRLIADILFEEEMPRKLRRQGMGR